METIRIEAEGKAVGRLASEIARLIQGKNTAGYRPYRRNDTKVLVVNTDKMRFTGKKLAQKKYFRHTGTIGHLKETPLSKRFAEDSRSVLFSAVRGMLPKNRLRKNSLKNLIILRTDKP